jgi:alkanesulfonate monooxygenase SsuD/methylene tetrahydromethanopterin reductase-like flavin-dependent oxidoreductase (luciferase family)
MTQDQKNKLTFGISLGPVPPWQRVVEWAKLVEALGYDKLWLPDHFVNPHEKKMPWFECWTLLTALAPLTNKIVIGSLVSSMTLRNPALLARAARTLDHISGGRMELGVGAAGTTHCHTMTGTPIWERSERSERYQEFVEILDQMLHNDVTTYAGKYYNIQEAWMLPRPISQPRPVFNVAAHGPKSLRLAASFGDAWNSYYPGKDLTPQQSSEVIRQRGERLCELATQAGRDPAHIGRTFIFGWTSDGLFRSKEAFYDTLGRYTEAGITDFVFVYALGLESWQDNTITTEEQLRWVAEEAVPRLRQGD